MNVLQHTARHSCTRMIPSADLLPRRSWLVMEHSSQATLPGARQHAEQAWHACGRRVSPHRQPCCSLGTDPPCLRGNSSRRTGFTGYSGWPRSPARRQQPPAALSGDSMQDFLVGSSLATAIGAAVFYGTRVCSGMCSRCAAHAC